MVRITNQALVLTAQRNLQLGKARLAAAQNAASSRIAISRPSDDPRGTAASMAVRSAQAASAQQSRNIGNGTGWLDTADSALTETSALLIRARTLVVQGASEGSLSATAREAIAIELTGIRDSLVEKANTTFAGRSIFAGSADTGSAVGPGYTFTGVPGDSVQRRVADNVTVKVDSDGAAIFGDGVESVFALIDSTVSDLRGGTNIGPRLAELDERMKTISGGHADIGVRQATLTRAQEALMTKNVQLESQRIDIEEVPIEDAVLNLQLQQVAYQTALGVTAKVLPATLMDYLR